MNLLFLIRKLVKLQNYGLEISRVCQYICEYVVNYEQLFFIVVKNVQNKNFKVNAKQKQKIKDQSKLPSNSWPAMPKKP